MVSQKIIKTAIGLLDKYPNSHIGGSFGLFLHGLDLGRTIKDLDICLKSDPGTIPNDKFNPGSFNDFDYSIEWNGIKIDVIIAPDQKWSFIEYGGYNYRVTDFNIIHKYKRNYCEKGVEKHCKDVRLMMEYINSKIRMLP